MFHDNDLRVASICDPRFKTSWLSDTGEIRQAEKLMLEVFNRHDKEMGMENNDS